VGLETGLAPRDSARLAQGSFFCSCSDIMNSRGACRGGCVERGPGGRRRITRRRFPPAA
jgi:hypothetical protein